MKPIKENLGLYAILIILIHWVYLFLYQFKFGPNLWSQRISYLFGPFAFVFLLLTIGAGISIFLNYKYNWIVISLPFLWNLLLPFKIAPVQVGVKGWLINVFIFLFQADFTGVFHSLINSVFPLVVIVYLFMKNIKNVQNQKFEIVFLVLILISRYFLLRLII